MSRIYALMARNLHFQAEILVKFSFCQLLGGLQKCATLFLLSLLSQNTKLACISN